MLQHPEGGAVAVGGCVDGDGIDGAAGSADEVDVCEPRGWRVDAILDDVGEVGGQGVGGERGG